MTEIVKSNSRVKVPNQGWQSNITVEPAYAFYCLVETIMKFLYQNLFLQKYCRAETDQEPDLDTKCDDETAGLKFVAYVNSWFLTPATFIACVYTMLAMSWSDRAGKRRKPLIFIPLIGMLLETGFAALQSYFWRWSVYWTVLSSASGLLIFGGKVCFSQTVYLYMIDITEDSNRSFRYGLLLTIRYLALPIGYFISGYILRSVGFFYSFLVCFVLTLMAIVSGVLLIHDISEPVPKALTFLNMINPKHAIESIKITFRKRPQNSRAIIIMMLLAYNLLSFTNEGEYSVMFLYFRNEFQWDERKIGVYFAYKLFGTCAGTIICSVILSKCLKLGDDVIGIFIVTAKSVAAMCYVFANNDLLLYIIPLIDMYHAAGIAVTRSFATQFVERKEYGHMSAVISLTKITVPLSQPLYNLVFANTLNTAFSSSFFGISVLFSLLILLLIIVSRTCQKSQNQKLADEALIQ